MTPRDDLDIVLDEFDTDALYRAARLPRLPRAPLPGARRLKNLIDASHPKTRQPNGEIPMPQLTGWMFTDATNCVPCPRCHAAPTDPCRKPSGGKTPHTHSERLAAFVASPLYVDANYLLGTPERNALINR